MGWREALGLVIGCVDRGRALVRCDVEEPRGRGDNAGVDMVVRTPARQVMERGPSQGISKIGL
jgi:hypothetical protein